MTEHLNGYPYSQDVITRLHGMAEVYRHFSQGKEVRTADLLDEAAGCISALLENMIAPSRGPYLMPLAVRLASERVRADAANTMRHDTTSDLSARLMCRVGVHDLGLVMAWVDQFAALALLPGGVPDGGWPKTNKPMMPVEEFLASQPGGVVPDREAIARVIGSYVVYDDKGGPDTEVLQDVIGGDHDESVRRVYELTDAIIAMLSAPAVPDGYVLVPREPTEAMVNAVWHHWLHGMGHSQECMRDALRAMLSASPKGTAVAESAAGDTSHLTASETPCKSEWPNPTCPCTDPLWCIQRELCKRTAQEPPSPTPCDLWRDISTAPKDGKPILLGWLEPGWVGEGRFIEDAGWFEAGAHPTDHTDGEVWPDLWMSMPELPLRVAGPCVLHPHSDEKDAGENDQSREEQNPSASPKEVR